MRGLGVVFVVRVVESDNREVEVTDSLVVVILFGSLVVPRVVVCSYIRKA